MNEQIKTRIEESVLAYCRQAGLFAPVGQPFAPKTNADWLLWDGGLSLLDRRVVVALSGGADSMALLRILMELRDTLKFTVAACHINHGLRGAAADADEAFVRQQCSRLGVPLLVYNARVKGEVPLGAGEDWARQLRYGVFETFGAGGNTLVATAHTLTDQAETLLFRLARGTGVHGAAGIPAARGIYIRPLLGLTRADTEAYCAAVEQPYVTDETNLTDAFARNRLRHHALPALEQANAAAQQNLGRFCERMARTDAYFAREGRRLLSMAAGAAAGEDPQEWDTIVLSAESAAGPWSLAVLQAADGLILESALHLLVAPVRDPEEKYIRLLCGIVQAGSGAVQLTDAVRFLVDGDVLRQETSDSAAVPDARTDPPKLCKPFFCGEQSLPGGYEIKIEAIQADILQNTPLVHKKDLKNMADYAKITASLVMLRTRQAGDVFRPAGRGVSKPLKKLFNELKIPQTERGRLPLLAAGNTVLWLWDQGFAEGLAPDEATRIVVRITQKKTEESKA